MNDLSARETLAADQRSAFDDDFILEHWPLSSAACQIRRERAAAQVWSTPDDRELWKAEAQAGIATLADAMVSDYERFNAAMQAATESAETYDSRSEGGWM